MLNRHKCKLAGFNGSNNSLAVENFIRKAKGFRLYSKISRFIYFVCMRARVYMLTCIATVRSICVY